MAKENTISISGELTFKTVEFLYRGNIPLIKQQQRSIFDLSQVLYSDNTGVALLVALASYAKKVATEVKFINLPNQLMAILQANQVEKILPLSS